MNYLTFFQPYQQMKRILICASFLVIWNLSTSQSIAINNSNTPPNENAILDISSSEKGILVPRMTSAERLIFASTLTLAETGMMVFDSEERHFYFWNGTSFTGINISSRIIDTDLDTEIRVEENPDDDIIRFYTSGEERWNINGPRLEPISSQGSILIGKDAGFNNTFTKGTNIAVGLRALYTTEDQINNIAFGDSSLFSNGLGASGDTEGNNNIGIGKSTLRDNTLGYENIALGSFSMRSNVSGSENTALGFKSLTGNTDGVGNTALGHRALLQNRKGQHNVGIGVNVLRNNISGNCNVVLGWNALDSASAVSNSIVIGSNAARSNKVSEIIAIGDSSLMNNGLEAFPLYGSRAVAIGVRALNKNSLGHYNIGVGYEALQNNTVGSSNTAIGTNSMQLNDNGFSNTAVGSFSLRNNLSGRRNSAIGDQALISNTTGSDNTALGNYAMHDNEEGVNNTAVGSWALYDNIGNRNVAVGARAAQSNTEGSGNVAIGNEALSNNSGVSGNVAIGDSALYRFNGSSTGTLGQVAIGDKSQISSTSGTNNTSIGTFTLYSNVTGEGNTAIGPYAAVSSTGDNNTALGKYVLISTHSGDENTGVGSLALSNNTTRHRRTAIGFSANSIGNYGNNTGLGNDADCTAAHQVRIGNTAVTSIGGYANWTNLSDGKFKKDVLENVVGLDFINQLRPVTYKLDLDAVHDFYLEEYGEVKRRRYEEASNARTMIRSGFIAQEVEALANNIGYDFSGVDAPKNKKDYYGLRYAAFVVPLVKAVQEQQIIIEEQDQRIKKLERKMANFEKQVLASSK